MHDPFDRRIGFIGVALVLGRLRNNGKAWKLIKEFLDPLIRSNDLFKDMPFLWIGIDFRYGIKNDLKVEYSRINKKYGDLCIAVELDMEILEWADRHNLDLLHDIFMIAALEALIQVGRKYKFPVNLFEEERRTYGAIPSTLEECETYVRTSNLG
jgi:hypothetical protein